MPSITNPNLTLSESEGQVTLRVEYDATFTPIDRHLAALGLNFHAHTTAHGSDGGIKGPTLTEFPRHRFEVTDGERDQVFEGVVERHTVARSVLGEDPVGDADEIMVNVRVHSPLPPIFTDDELSDIETLTSAG
ncbi:hypothetical protein [Cellulomonas fimi]|uniref:hypothetical protein n=1 Tax=Cellulomonas fimi TaxID=1708 RepID=UPI00235991FC|nr:hypothetical protein [Cellulomonas fimi]